jgi:surface polysaccharide O-acyltransferase-like enzyme
MITTGYLCCEKQLKIGREWIIKLLRIIIPFIITTIILIVYYRLSNTEHNPFEMFFGIEKYSYAWYVEMYIGLYLLMPFINLSYAALKTKRKKAILIGIMIFLTFIPSVLSRNWDLSIDYWKVIYPITYYLIGGFIKEYGCKLSKLKLIIIMLMSLAYNTFIALLTSNGTVFSMDIIVGYNSLYVLITSLCIFCILLKLNLEKCHNTTKRILKTVSNATLSIYLISKLFDSIIYSFVISHSSADFMHNYFYAPITIISVFLLSSAVGLPIQKVSSVLTNAAMKSKDRIRLTK